MVLPFVNMTIKGATWFQGENNCAECDARCDGTGKDKCHGATDPANVCGNILGDQHTAACMQQVSFVAGLRSSHQCAAALQRTPATLAIST